MRNALLFWQKHYPSLILLLAGLFFGWMYLFLYRGIPETATLIFNQPDEMANYAFTKEWTLNRTVGIEEPLATLSGNQIHPRSMTVVDGRLVPIGFPGFIAVLTSFVSPLVWAFGPDSFNFWVVLLTPLVAAVSSILIYGISRSLGLGRGAALVSGLGLLVLPAWWYYASRPLQGNTIFVFFILSGVWAALRLNNKISRFFLIGLSFGLALYVRPSEWLWVFGLIGWLGYYNRVFLKTKTVVMFGLSSGLMALIFFLTQFAFYGSLLGSGYVRPAADGSAGLITSGPQGIFWLKAILLPFGVNGLVMIKTLFYYGLKLFLPWVLTVLIGFGFVISNRKSLPKLHTYALGLIGLGAWLTLYYGSWQFADNLAGQASIGSSQVRYFLPLYVLTLPLVGYLIAKIYTWHWSGKIVAGLMCVALLGASVKSVFFKFEGLSQVKQTVNDYYEWQRKIMNEVPDTAIVVTRYGDKYVYPHRAVIATVDTVDGQTAVKQLLARGADVYWYDIQMEKPGQISDPGALALQGQGVELDKPIATWENLELRPLILKK